MKRRVANKILRREMDIGYRNAQLADLDPPGQPLPRTYTVQQLTRALHRSSEWFQDAEGVWLQFSVAKMMGYLNPKSPNYRMGPRPEGIQEG